MANFTYRNPAINHESIQAVDQFSQLRGVVAESITALAQSWKQLQLADPQALGWRGVFATP